MATMVRTGMNLIQAGLFRGPAVLASLMGACYIGELAMRGLQAAGSRIGINPPSADSGSVGEKMVKAMRPYKDLPLQEVAINGLALSVIGTVGFHLAAWAFGPAPAVYNNVLSYLGPIRIDNTPHPLLTAARNYFGV
jgi:hypothetical protein